MSTVLSGELMCLGVRRRVRNGLSDYGRSPYVFPYVAEPSLIIPDKLVTWLVIPFTAEDLVKAARCGRIQIARLAANPPWPSRLGTIGGILKSAY